MPRPAGGLEGRRPSERLVYRRARIWFSKLTIC
jgi:hypothetical protein